MSVSAYEARLWCKPGAITSANVFPGATCGLTRATLAAGEWSDACPEPIDLEAVVERWLPGLARDGRLVAVFPNASGESSTIGPLDLLERIECERDKISDD
ncbi:DUF2750 domain-containing protein [Lysobacter sp. MMG2]|nr:DUF2750 domain-containing protein [Lysobacter sp. MMG2]